MGEKALLLVSITLSFAACEDSSERSPSAAGSATTTEPIPADMNVSEDLTEKMRHCPVTLPGVKTELVDVDGGVRFVLTATAADVVTEAQRLTIEQCKADAVKPIIG